MKRDEVADNQATSEVAPQKLAIEVKGLCKAFGRTPVLRDLDLEVPWGEVLTILGPNGSGKTTLIKILATLTRSDSGTVRVGGLDVTRRGQRVRRLIGVVTHDTLLYDDLTGYENLKFFARMFGLDRIDERVFDVVERMGVSSRLHQRVGTLSHGLKKRFTIARALLHDPAILLMDEPESGLDQEALALMEDVITDKTIPYRTVIMTTHNLERGLALGQRMAILSHGRIAYQESLEAVGAATLRDAYFRHTGVESS
ncbi:MAG: ABC transporter ATP-binding protein [Chloroflexi bacterium]|nr:ABC transporter ATP-binding protein [Chloroflexota bacterium]